MRIHPNSGAGTIKDDGSDDDFVYEVKDANRSFTLKSADIRALTTRAIRQGKLPRFLIYFGDGDYTLDCQVVPGGKELL